MKITILCVRHPDFENTYTIQAPEGVEVEIKTMDLGSSFDAGNHSYEESEVAEWAAHWLYTTAAMEEGPVRDEVLSTVGQVLADAKPSIETLREALDEEADAARKAISGGLVGTVIDRLVVTANELLEELTHG